ncbi:MAG: DUF4861 family protein [Candidatus Latescibacter sp.]|nr:DUF4861 family protein [Candidatus Latescibacter sp.]
MKYLTVFLLIVLFPFHAGSQSRGPDYQWYTEGNYIPATRVKVVLKNVLDFGRTYCPVIIPRKDFPIPNISDFYVTVVDPSLPSDTEPTEAEIKAVGGWKTRQETNGHYLRYQLDDLDKDGLWDELYFACDIKPKETKTVYVYVQPPQQLWLRGLYRHETHCIIGNYERNFIPWWESEVIGWKIATLTDVDLFGKRERIMITPMECIENWAGYNRPYRYGLDILLVGSTFGAAGLCLFEEPAIPDSVSRPRFSPTSKEGQYYNTRYSRDVVVNGPMRSIILVRTMDWRSGKGLYALDQYYTAYADKYYSTCKAVFKTFVPEEKKTLFGCGMRAIMDQYDYYQKGGTVISYGKNVVIESPSPDEKGQEKVRAVLDFEGLALVVKDKYKPQYQYVKSYGGNHCFRIPVNDEKTFEYLFAGAWSEGLDNKNREAFQDYVLKAAQEFNNPLDIVEYTIEKK